MKKTNTIWLMLTCLFCFLQIQALTFVVKADNSDFEVVDGVLVAYHGAGGDVVIPDNLGITKIGNLAFAHNASLISVIIPEGVITIGNNAFLDCGLTSVTIPNSVMSIESWAFAYNSLTSITIPSSVEAIGNLAFGFCPNFALINVDDSNKHYSSEEGVLYDKNKTILYVYPTKKNNLTFIIPNSVIEISLFAFLNCNNLTSITIPNDVVSIGDSAFSGCNNLASITVNWIKPLEISLESNIFFGVNKNTCTLFIPENTLTDYKIAPVWKDFENIFEMAGIYFEITNLLLFPNTTWQLNAIIFNNNAIYWSSNNMSVATVSSSGLITTVGEGTAIITVTTEDGNFSASCTVTVDSKAPAMEIEQCWASPSYEWCWECFNGNGYFFTKTPYYEGTVLKDPIEVEIIKTSVASENVIYSLYTYKKEYLNKIDGGYGYFTSRIDNYLASIDPQKTQSDIDKNLDKIYEFPVVTETPNEYNRVLYWDGKTDSKFTGKSMPVRASLHIAAHNANTGELIAIKDAGAIQTYGIFIGLGSVDIDVNKDKEDKETISAKIYLAFDNRPVKLTALLLTTPCGLELGSTYDMVNKGTEAMIAAVNSSGGEGFPPDILAYKELTNPTVDPQNNMIKIYEWKDIQILNWNDQKWKNLLSNPNGAAGGGWPWVPFKAADGNYFAARPEEQYTELGFLIGIIVEAFDDDGNPIETYTGVNEGYTTSSPFLEVPRLTNPKSIFTGIPAIKNKEGITISAMPNGNFKIICNNGGVPESFAIYDVTGKLVKAGKLSGAKEETIATNLRPGFYVISVNTIEGGGKYIQKVVVDNR